MTANLQPDGSCLTCIFHFVDCEHRTEERRRERAFAAHLAGVLARARGADIDRICGRFELESDEFSTADQKAQRFLA